MRALIRHLDRHLRRRLGVFEFSDHPDCIFRASVGRSKRPVPIPGGELPAGSRVLEIHLWNERVPQLPADGADVGWAVRGRRLMLHSFREVARSMATDERLRDVQAVGGVTVLSLTEDGRSKALFTRLGFAVTPLRQTLGRLGELAENFHSMMIMWAYNAATLRDRHLLRLRRSEFWMGADDFGQRYASVSDRAQGSGRGSRS